MEHLEDDLEEELIRLGFTNVAEIVRTANQGIDQPADGTKIIGMDDLYSDPDDIGYIFIAEKTADDGHWVLRSIDASVQLDTTPNIEKVLVTGNTYDTDKGPLPSREVIRQAVLEKVRLEKLKERFDGPEQGSKNRGLKR